MDLQKIIGASERQDTAECEVFFGGSSFFIEVHGVHTKTYERAKRKAVREFVARCEKEGIDDLESDEAMDIDIECQRRAMAECVVRWRELQDNGVDVPFDKEVLDKILMVYEIYEQVKNFMQGQEVFT